jgi:hypothetical protein
MRSGVSNRSNEHPDEPVDKVITADEPFPQTWIEDDLIVIFNRLVEQTTRGLDGRRINRVSIALHPKQEPAGSCSLVLLAGLRGPGRTDSRTLLTRPRGFERPKNEQSEVDVEQIWIGIEVTDDHPCALSDVHTARDTRSKLRP